MPNNAAQKYIQLAVQRMVNDMIKQDILIWEEIPNQKRSKLIAMAAKGEQAFERALELQDPWVKALYAGISKKHLIEAKEVLIAIGVKLENQT